MVKQHQNIFSAAIPANRKILTIILDYNNQSWDLYVFFRRQYVYFYYRWISADPKILQCKYPKGYNFNTK